jgi:hypothetical protein
LGSCAVAVAEKTSVDSIAGEQRRNERKEERDDKTRVEGAREKQPGSEDQKKLVQQSCSFLPATFPPVRLSLSPPSNRLLWDLAAKATEMYRQFCCACTDEPPECFCYQCSTLTDLCCSSFRNSECERRFRASGSSCRALDRSDRCQWRFREIVAQKRSRSGPQGVAIATWEWPKRSAKHSSNFISEGPRQPAVNDLDRLYLRTRDLSSSSLPRCSIMTPHLI